MRSFFRKYSPFIKAQIQEFITYRASAVVWVLMELFVIALQYFIWKAIFTNSSETVINGYTYEGMITYVFVIRIIFSLTFTMPSSYISDDVKSGAIAMMLIKPINYQGQLFFKALGEIVNSFFFFVIPVTIVMLIVSIYVPLQISLTVVSTLAFIFSVIFAFLIRFLIGYVFGLIVFLTINSFGIFQLRRAIESIFSGMIIPIAFFPPLLKTISNFLPFMHGLYVPARILMGNYQTDIDILYALLFQFTWVVILYLLGLVIWKKVVHRLVVMGG